MLGAGVGWSSALPRRSYPIEDVQSSPREGKRRGCDFSWQPLAPADPLAVLRGLEEKKGRTGQLRSFCTRG